MLRVLQSLRFIGLPRPKAWAAALGPLAEHPEPVFAWEFALALDGLRSIASESEGILEHVGLAARRLLVWAFDRRATNAMVDRLGSVWLVPLVAQTFSTDAEASQALLDRVIANIGDPDVSVDWASRLAHVLNEVWTYGPALAADFYVKVFSNFESSEEKTHMGGVVISLTSTRRQDYEMVQYSLKEHTPDFLRATPEYAVPAVTQAINAQVAIRELAGRVDAAQIEVTGFDLLGGQARYLRDASHFWDAIGAVHEDQHELAHALVAYLDELLEGGHTAEATAVVGLVADNAEVAFIWRRLLVAGARNPDGYRASLYGLLLVPTVLASPETVKEAADFLRAVIPLLSDDECLLVEQTVIAISEDTSVESDRPHPSAARLIQQFPDDRLQTVEDRALKEATAQVQDATANRPLVEFSTFSEPYTERDWLREQGVDFGDPAVEALLEAAKPLEQFVESYRNEAPPADAVATISQELVRVMDMLEAGGIESSAVLNSAWAKVGGVAVTILRWEGSTQENLRSVLRRALLRCAAGDAPTRDTVDDFTFPMWSPAARNEAAQGLPCLAAVDSDEAVLTAIEGLAADPVPSVRYLLASHLWRIEEAAPSIFWAIAAKYFAEEQNPLVLDSMASSLGIVASRPNADERRVTELLDALLRRTDVNVRENARTKAEGHVSGLVVGLALGRGNDWALQELERTPTELPDRVSDVAAYVWQALQFVHVNRVGIADHASATNRALEWLSRVVESTTSTLRTATDGGVQGETTRELFEILDDIVSRLYFHSGVYERENRPIPAPAQVCEYFGLVKPILGVIVEYTGGPNGTGLPASTAHHFVELLRGTVGCDPESVLYLTRRVVDSAVGSGYAFDALAAREVTALVGEVLADHRDVVQTGEPLDNLMSLLDTFVSAGWPDAQRLVLRLEEIFR